MLPIAEYTGNWLRPKEKSHGQERTFQLFARVGCRSRHRNVVRAEVGQETRDLIKNKAGEGSEYIKQRSGELKDTASGWVDKGKEAVGRQKETLNDAVEAGKQAYRDAVS